MIRPAGTGPVYLYALPVDMRKSIDGLAALIEQEMALSPFESALFVFCNCSRDKLKILCWERNCKRPAITIGLRHGPAHDQVTARARDLDADAVVRARYHFLI
ncbi:IS66 family insertion sequence element accessory protein TnpB [Marinobacterium sedimentorum]|uniref:IS66 family insertion sequence element accessory protein TnpB n=1 Tax=Marinobacterium sedimentorum TaxID=2927804 RepID=UPI0020C63B3B|nr:IS66 family insertion sequence element accessory protein TnpB [Marinobacterium sedimentorum]MCP8689009.1 IS66 family insertion sequence element accessory protein TnpB [Marinobacterium sedimentorum]